MLKRIVLIVLLVIVAAGGIIAYEWYKPAKTGATSSADVTITAPELVKEYSANEQAGNAKYLDKNIQVSGTVTEVNKDQDGGVMVVLESGDPINNVQCAMLDKNVSITKGQNVTIKGLCSGFSMGVALRTCVLSK